MGDTASNIVITATNKARANLQSVSTDFDHITTAAKRAETSMAQVGRNTPGLSNLRGGLSGANQAVDMLTGGFGGLAAAMGVAGIAAGAMELGKVAVELTKIGEESAQVEARFRAFSGGVTSAADNLRVMDAALGLAMTKDEKMATVSTLLSSGIAENAQQAAQLSKAAMVLGDAHESASQRINTLTRALATGRVTALIPYGVDLDNLKNRAKELQAANAGLAASEAMTTAFLEQSGAIMARVEAEGGKAATSTQELSNAWADLKDKAGGFVAPVMTPFIQALADALQGTTEETKREIELQAAQERAATATANLANARRNLASMTAAVANAEGSGNAWLVAQAEGSQRAAQAAVDHATAEYRAANAALTYADAATTAAAASMSLASSSDVGTAAILRQAAALGSRSDQFANWAAIQANLSTGGGTRMTMPATDTSGYNAFVGGVVAESGNEILRAKAIQKQFDDMVAGWNKVRTVGTSAATSTASAWDKTLSGMASQVSSFATQAASASKALTPGGAGNEADWLKPGSNGPFENLFRAKDVAVRGESSQWAKALGMTQEDAKKITQEFEAGIMSAGVKALVDKQAIVDRVRLQKLAEETESAFADEIAAAAGADTRSVDEILGFTDAKVTTAGANVGAKMGKALDAQSGTLKTAGAGMADNTLSGLDTKTQDFYNLGFKQGQQYLAGQVAALDAHSPSRAMMRLGKAALEGFNIGASGGYGFGGVSSGSSGGSRGGGSPTMYSRTVRYYEGDYNTFIVNSDAALGTVLAAQRASKQKRLGTG